MSAHRAWVLLFVLAACQRAEEAPSVDERRGETSAESARVDDPASAVEAPTLADPETSVTASLDVVASLEAIGRLQAWALGEGGRVLRVDANGALHLEQFYASAAQGAWRVHGDTIDPATGVVGGAWTGPLAATLHAGTPPSPEAPALDGVLNLWFLADTPRHEQADLPGAPVDVFLDLDHERAWVLTRRGREGSIHAVSLSASALGDIEFSASVDRGPVGIEADPTNNQLAVPSHDGRAVHVFALSPPALQARIDLDTRPTNVLFGPDGVLLTAPANAPQARTVDLDHGADGQVNPLPKAITRWTPTLDGSAVFGVAAGAASVHRFSWPYLQEQRVRDTWPGVEHRALPLAVVATPNALFVADASPGASHLWALHPDTLEVLARAPLTDAPAALQAFEGDVLVAFPGSGAVQRFALEQGTTN